MAISSALNPQNIIGNRQGTAEQFQNFMTGGNGSLGSSIVNSTSSNKIVPFERGGVRPITPNFNSIISNISTKTDTVLDTNIKNQDNKVQGVITNIQNVFQTTLQNFTKGYQDKIKSIEDSKPSGILEKFFGLYNNVTGFIQFFGDRKNLNKISTSLKGLRGLFEDSFETAKLIRKTINKIVKQLSSLPVATPSGGGGFNLDIRVPGSPLKNAAGKVLGGGRGKMLALGAGALGTGMLAGGAINALSGSENIQPAVVQQSIPENLADSLSSIIDRFTNAVNSLIKTAGEKPKTTPRTSGGGGGSPAPSPTPGSPPGSPGVTIKDDTQALKELGLTQEQYTAIKQGVADVEGARYNQMGGAGTRFAGRYQMGSNEIADSAKVMGIPVPSQQEYLNNPELQEKIYMGRTVYMHRRLQSLSPKYNTMSPRERAVALGMGQLGEGNVSSYINTGIVPRDSRNVPITKWGTAVGKRFDESSSIPPKSQPKPQAQVAPAPTQKQANQALATGISQPVKPQATVTPISMPPQILSAGEASQGGGGGGGGISAPPLSGGGPSVPFLPAGNPNNFLVLYSKMVYNIVDA
jgi:hypothetical protein